MCDDTAAVERWLPVPGYEGSYEVSDLGRIRSIDRYVRSKGNTFRLARGQILEQRLGRRGRPAVRLSANRIYRTFRLHRLVLAVFVGPCPSGMEGCHDNGNKTDNRLANLRWDTPSANMHDRVRHGGHQMRNRTHCPQGHRLEPPNIPARYIARGHRTCLACTRARSRQARHGREPGFNLQDVADQYYAVIMAERESA